MSTDDGERLQHSLEDLVRRGRVMPSDIALICERQGLRLPAAHERHSTPPEAIDYVSLLEEVHSWQQTRKSARKSRRKRVAGILKLD